MAGLLHRSRSKDGTNSPAPGLYMSNRQMGDYLSELRQNRTPRPTGARPPPPSSLPTRKSTNSTIQFAEPTISPIRPSLAACVTESIVPTARSASAQSHHRNISNISTISEYAGRPLVQQPGANISRPGSAMDVERTTSPVPYVESGQRWMEKQEARSLRLALEDMDIKEDEKLHKAAQDEASELVWRHQNPNAPYPNPNAPYRPEDRPRNYRDHLRRGSHSRSQSWSTLRDAVTGKRSSSTTRSASGGSGSGNEKHEHAIESPVEDKAEQNPLRSSTFPQVVKAPEQPPMDSTEILFSQRGRRRISASRRKASGPFINPNDQIYEEPEESSRPNSSAEKKQDMPPAPVQAEVPRPTESIVPLRVRRNPFSRVQQAKENLTRSQTMPLPDTKPSLRSPIRPLTKHLFRSPTNTVVTPSSDVSGYVSNPSSASPTPPASRDDSQDEEVKVKDGKEVRGEDIRSATSMRMKDRSPKLPQPTVVSDAPGRPIVSFKNDWKPKEKELEEVVSQAPGKDFVEGPGRFTLRKQKEDTSPRPSPITTASAPVVPNGRRVSSGRVGQPKNEPVQPLAPINAPNASEPKPRKIPDFTLSDPWDPNSKPLSVGTPKLNERKSQPPKVYTDSQNRQPAPIPVINVPDAAPERPRPVPSISFSQPAYTRPQPIPTINVPGESQRPKPPAISASSSPSTRPLPTIAVNNASSVPRIAVDPSPAPARPLPSIAKSAPSVPTIAVDSAPARPLPNPSISAAPPVPSISVNAAQSAPPARPLPTPRRGVTFPRPGAPVAQTNRSHWTPTTFNTGALCTHCGIAISGRTVSAAGSRFHPECFVCYHCGEGLECVAFFPEPDNARAERIDRIHRRQNGEYIEGEEADGDEGMRFYCHLDFHEFFSPRCKSCKTPIEGEVVVACGAEWHVGHFFCAQCGDPFDSQTPFVEKDNYAWCLNCHTNRYSAKCKKCRKPVTDVVVKALGKEWHEQCFCCFECNGPFEDGRYFLRQGEEEPVCVRCEERRLKA